MGKFVLGLIVGVIVFFIAVYVYFATGIAPVATAAPPMPFENMFANKALHAKLDKEAPKTVPLQADDATYAAGAQVYKEHCEVCHGLPTGQQTDRAGDVSQAAETSPWQGCNGRSTRRDILDSGERNSHDRHAGI